MRVRPRWLALSAFLLCLPAVAHANMGSVLMVAGAFHLIVLNWLIALIEALVVWGVFRLHFGRAFAFLAIANYGSAFVGLATGVGVFKALHYLIPGEAPLFRISAVMWSSWALAYLCTVLIETPFCLWLIKQKREGLKRAVHISLVAQTVSYALLIPYYFSAGNLGVLQDVRIQRDLAFVQPPSAWVYYLHPEEGSVWRIRTDGTQRSKVADTAFRDPYARLYATLEPNTQQWDLWAATRGKHSERVLENFAARCAPNQYTEDSWFNFNKAADLRPENEQDWECRCGFWPGEGLSVSHERNGAYQAGFASPFEQWLCRNATILPNNQVVYQLDDQIVILDMPSRTIGFLTRGRGPLVAFDP